MPATATILTPRLQLSPVTRRDGWELWELWNKPAVRDALFGRAALPIDAAMALVDACSARDAGLWAVRSPLTTRLLGCVSLCGWPRRTLQAPTLAAGAEAAEFSIAMLPSLQGLGYGFEAASAVIEQTIRAARVSDVHARVRRSNARGLSLMNRLGFRSVSQAAGDGPCIDFSLHASIFFALLRARTKWPQERPADRTREPARTDADDFLDTDVMLDI
jgi:RimJ/RimL family protein N-acetyltransferase